MAQAGYVTSKLKVDDLVKLDLDQIRHLSEALSAIEKYEGEACFITHRDDHVASRLQGRELFYINDPHTSLLAYMKNGVLALYLFLKLRPRVVLSTGAGLAIIFCLLCKLFGSKLIFVETGARVTTPSKSGRFMYRYADRFYVQWPAVTREYPEAIYKGRLL